MSDLIFLDTKVLVPDSKEDLTNEDILEILRWYDKVEYYRGLRKLDEYYKAKNITQLQRYRSRKIRNKVPNNLILAPYYATLVDTVAGYMFQNIKYLPDTEEAANKDFVQEINKVLELNDAEILDMRLGVDVLKLNVAFEHITLVQNLTVSQVRLQPLNVITIYRMDETELFAVLHVQKSHDKGYLIDSINQNTQLKLHIDKDKKINVLKTIQTDYGYVPVVIYTATNDEDAPYVKILSYVDALDFLLSGNTDEIERLADAILALSGKLRAEDKEQLNELRLIEGLGKEARAEFITKTIDPVFREFVARLLISEIYRHAHVVDWHSDKAGGQGDTSAKALRMRLFDMFVASQPIEKNFREGLEKRIEIITKLLNFKSVDSTIGIEEQIDIKFIRTIPTDVEDIIPAINNATYISYQTKCEMTGIDWTVEKPRLIAEGILIENDPFDLVPPEEPTGTLD